MSIKRILGWICLLAGIASFMTSLYIKGEVRIGKGKISRAEERVSQGKALFDVLPGTKPIGEGLSAGAQQKIDEGKSDVNKYEVISKWLKIGGGVLILLGFVLLLFRRKKK